MITINGNILENRYTTAQWAAITAVLPDRVWGHEIDAGGNPVGSKMGDGVHLWSALGYWYGGGVISQTLTTADPDTYTLSPAELIILNRYSRYPNFVAITTVSGLQWFDIIPRYTGTVGNFTACVVQLHSDGAGNNAENTVIQFS